ncbi:hypothetical protein M9H77_07928 [Catharanthus roseus]|uniref:Uncharacterized protein n=1 Tax=Catharanthus roseus TaxID=4058 RepID=A0ACC0BWR5_CATRO|nr:hypothetical protein M9H77_07928 [Catharanthus roseus]
MGKAKKLKGVKERKPIMSKVVEETLMDTQCMIINRDMKNGSSTNQDLELMKQSLRNRFGVGNHEVQRQGQPKVKFMELLMVQQSPKIKELSQAKIEESLKIHVRDEISKEEPCCIMSEKSIEIKEKERVENKKRD